MKRGHNLNVKEILGLIFHNNGKIHAHFIQPDIINQVFLRIVLSKP